MIKIKKSVLIIIVCVSLLLILFVPYIKAEILTMKYGDEFDGLQKQTNMRSNAEYYRVLSYSHDTAKVFYVSGSGDLLTFKKDATGAWKYSEWKTIWSNSGSASEFMWPYYH